MRPRSMNSRRLMQRTRVVLPDPDLPTRTRTSAFARSRETPSNTLTGPKDLWTSTTRTIGAAGKLLDKSVNTLRPPREKRAFARHVGQWHIMPAQASLDQPLPDRHDRGHEQVPQRGNEKELESPESRRID